MILPGRTDRINGCPEFYDRNFKYVAPDRVTARFHRITIGFFATHLGQTRYNFSPDHGKWPDFIRKHAELNYMKSAKSPGLRLSKKVFAPCRYSRPRYPINFDPSLRMGSDGESHDPPDPGKYWSLPCIYFIFFFLPSL